MVQFGNFLCKKSVIQKTVLIPRQLLVKANIQTVTSSAVVGRRYDELWSVEGIAETQNNNRCPNIHSVKIIPYT